MIDGAVSASTSRDLSCPFSLQGPPPLLHHHHLLQIPLTPYGNIKSRKHGYGYGYEYWYDTGTPEIKKKKFGYVFRVPSMYAEVPYASKYPSKISPLQELCQIDFFIGIDMVDLTAQEGNLFCLFCAYTHATRLQQSFVNAGGALLRAAPCSVFSGVHDSSPKLKLTSVRYFSSAEPPLHMVIGMPALSPTMTQGNIAKWRKREGEKIEVGDVICEIETDKATLEFECLEEGYMAKILVPEGSKDVPVGQPIAITVEDADDIQNVPATVTGNSEVKEDNSTPQNEVREQEASSIKIRASELPPHIILEMPALSPTMVEDADNIQNVPATVTGNSEVKEDNSTPQNEVREQEASSIKIRASELPPHIILEMPALSPTMSQGNIAKWMKKEGDKIGVGDVLCEIETDKATVEFESLEEGFLAKILVPEGSKDVSVGQHIAITVEDQNDIETIKTSVSGGSEVKEEKPTHHDTRSEAREQKANFNRISPSAKLLITEHGLDASLIMASGPRGTLLKGDVLAAIKSGKASPKTSSKEKISQTPQIHPQTSHSASPESKSHLQQPDSYENFPNSQIRKVIAKRLLESKQNTPHLYLSSDVILDPLLSFRKELKGMELDLPPIACDFWTHSIIFAQFTEKHDVKVSVNDIIIKAVAIALRNVPEANAYWDTEKGEVVLLDSVDISIAVATEKGLMTPIVRNADQKTISSISLEIKELASRARAGKLTPNEFQGGTFRGNQVVEPVFGTDGRIEKPAVVTKMNLTLSADHRVFDGKVGGSFIADLRLNFSDMRRLLLPEIFDGNLVNTKP
ncbi:hypothetical protein TEA_000762 [Camellia sinensis var. sinensis]|uniref:Dihydrolipoamide acetyltransferase component of pyruvate dehydrogenase complex n=1 Tax=Camellia sinensis var. sinensis TaxID=542762 RepID=A0A4S4DMS8_CAMSN|nr:hypothetical protein TEA_000762 [Camellia sinensis var. sinensis]